MASSSGEKTSEDIILQVIGQQMALYPRTATGATSSEVRIVQIPATTAGGTVSCGSSCVASWPGNAPTISIPTDPQKLFDLRTNTYTAITGISKDGTIHTTTVGEVVSMETVENPDSPGTGRLVTVEVRIPEDEELKARLALQRLEINDSVKRVSTAGSQANPFNDKLLCCPFIVCEDIVDDAKPLDDDDDDDDEIQRPQSYRFQELAASSTMMVTLPVPSPFDLVVDERRRPPLYVFNQVFKSNQ